MLWGINNKLKIPHAALFLNSLGIMLSSARPKGRQTYWCKNKNTALTYYGLQFATVPTIITPLHF